MRGGNLTTGAAQLQEALESLEEVWKTSEAGWNDANRQNLESEYLEPLLLKLRATLDGIGVLSQVMSAARRECES